ncbi:hypothetical protein C0995_013608 [Termitomyces sp. Mi166|nr:hypothetical protein C0995_013608 [Termitomyces sp. Mi166\
MVNSYLPPHEYLPVDILQEIFSHVVTRAGTIDIPHHLTNTLPWSLGQVCSDWREIVHSHPCLWRNIRLTTSITKLRNGDFDRLDRILPYGLPALNIQDDNDIYETIRNDKRADYVLGASLLSQLRSLRIRASLAALLELLSAIPSSIALSEVSLDITHPVVDGLQNLKLFTATKNLTWLKLQTFHTDNATHNATAMTLLHLPHISFDRLTHLDLQYLCDGKFPEFWEIWNQCTSLKKLCLPTFHTIPLPSRLSHPFLPRLEALTISWAIQYEPFPLKQLKTLSLNALYLQEMIDILRQTTHLESLSLSSIWFSESSTYSTMLRLDSVESLSLDTDCSFVLDFLNFPKLTTLDMEKGNWGIMTYSLPTRRIRAFIARSGCILETFNYESPVAGKGPNRHKILRSLLDALPSLRNFSASYESVLFRDKLLNEMIGNVLLPKVQMLRICVASPALFADFIESRVNAELREEGFIRLKTVFAYYPASKRANDALERLEAMNNMYGTDFRMVAD